MCAITFFLEECRIRNNTTIRQCKENYTQRSHKIAPLCFQS